MSPYVVVACPPKHDMYVSRCAVHCAAIRDCRAFWLVNPATESTAASTAALMILCRVTTSNGYRWTLVRCHCTVPRRASRSHVRLWSVDTHVLCVWSQTLSPVRWGSVVVSCVVCSAMIGCTVLKRAHTERVQSWLLLVGTRQSQTNQGLSGVKATG